MRKQYWFAFIIVALFIFVFDRHQNPQFNPNRSTVRRIRTLDIIEKQIEAEKTMRASQSAKPNVGDGDDEDIKNANAKNVEIGQGKSCWEKVREDYAGNPDFKEQNRQRLDSVVGDWFYNLDSPVPKAIEETSAQGRFFLALGRAGFLEGRKLKEDSNEALSLLRDISANDPENSAPYLFAALIEQKKGNKEKAHEYLEKARASKYFNSYLKEFTFALFDGVKTPADLLAATEIWSTTPVPNHGKLRTLLTEEKLVNVAEQMLQDGMDLSHEQRADLGWDPLEYAIGKKVLDSLGRGQQYPDWRDIMRRYQSPMDEEVDVTINKLNKTCDLSSLENEVVRIRRYLDQVRR